MKAASLTLKTVLPLLLICFYSHVLAQVKRSVLITVLNEKRIALAGATVNLLTEDSIIVRSAAANAVGTTEFSGINR